MSFLPTYFAKDVQRRITMVGTWLVRAERVELLLSSAFDGSVADAMAAIEEVANDYILLPQTEDYVDGTLDNFEVGIELGRLLGPDQRVFVATMDDGPDTVHAFFIALTEDEVIEHLAVAIEKAKERGF
jgi:hypothetical protein